LQVQGYNNKFVNSRRVGVLNITNWKEYADMKVGWRLNPSAWILPADRCSEPWQNVDVYPNSQYLHQMFHSLSYSQDIILDPWEYKLVLKIDTRTDWSWSQIGKVRITWRNWDTVLNESDWSVFTWLSIKEIVPAYYPIV